MLSARFRKERNAHGFVRCEAQAGLTQCGVFGRAGSGFSNLNCLRPIPTLMGCAISGLDASSSPFEDAMPGRQTRLEVRINELVSVGLARRESKDPEKQSEPAER